MTAGSCYVKLTTVRFTPLFIKVLNYCHTEKIQAVLRKLGWPVQRKAKEMNERSKMGENRMKVT